MKNRNLAILLGVLLAIVLLVVFASVGTYNSLARSREAVDSAQAGISTQLQRRMDLIPNLVETVKGYAAHEQEAIDSVTQARAKLAGATGMGDRAAANDQLNSALSRLMVIVENYPQLKADANFRQLADELAGTENRIAVARKDYNEAVRSYNQRIITFPGSLYAGIFGFEKAEYFEAAAGAETPPTVAF